MKRLHRALAGLLCAAALAVLLCGCGTSSAPTLTVDALAIGKADALILHWGEHCMIIDCGEEKHSREILDFLTWEGIRAVDVLVITHFDKDHVGGAPGIMDEISIGSILTPDYEGTGEAYRAFADALTRTGLTARRLSKTESFTIGGVTVRLDPAPADIAAAEVDDDYDNDMSLITTVTHGSVRMLFTGDIEKARTASWLAAGGVEPCQLIKMPHHGRYNKQVKALLDAVQPQEAIICCESRDTVDSKTLEALEDHAAGVWMTKDGDVRAVSSGKELEVMWNK